MQDFRWAQAVGRLRLSIVILVVASFGSARLAAQAPAAIDKEPLLRLEAGGPTSFVTALAFAPDGQTLYAAGFDKVVRAWTLGNDGRFALDRAAYRVPIGPGTEGAINAIAVSPDGTWLAIGGLGVIRGSAGFRNPGVVLPDIGALTLDMRLDRGRIYLFNTRTRALTVLRGHQGPVLALAFAPARQNKGLLLASAALEFDREKNGDVGALRLWNVPGGQEIANAWDQPDRDTRPGLAISHTGPGAKDVRVSFAWGDGKFRVWDVASGNFWRMDDGEDSPKANFNIALAAVGESKVLTGSLSQGDGSVHLWDVSGADGQRLDQENRALFSKEGDVRQIPRSIALLSSQAGGAADYAAVALRDVGKGGEKYTLRLLSLARLDESRAPILLWEGSSSLPVLASVPGGRYLAVAGNRNHEIHIFAVEDLLKDQARPRQVLRSLGIRFPAAALVRNADGGRGLLFKAATARKPGALPEGPTQGDLILDFTARSIIPAGAGWKLDTPAPAAAEPWKTEWNGASVSVSQGGQRIGVVTLKNGQTVTDFALRPPANPGDAPILAVAYQEKGQTMLCLYDVRTGDEIYQYTGHTDPIRSIVFSADGRLMVTAAEDQTVCVWGVNEFNLGLFLGKRGRIRGLAVKQDQGVVTVARIDDDSPASGKLAVGDVIEKVVDAKGTAKALNNARDFYETIFLLKPGSQAGLQVRGKGAVQLPVIQGIGDRKPLLCLFITRGEKPNSFEWVGWSPIGPYDSSGPRVDRQIGWHFNNTDQPEGPCSFALATEYRKQRREGILKHLIARGSLAPALKDWQDEDLRKPLPRPKMTGWIDEIGPDPLRRAANGQFLVRQAPVTLKVAIDDFPLDKIEQLRWEVVGDQTGMHDFTENQGRERSVDLGRILAQPGVATVRMVLRTVEAQPREYTQEIRVRYQPPAPRVRWAADWLKKLDISGEQPVAPVLTHDADFEIAASVEPAQPGLPLKIAVQQGNQPPQEVQGPAVATKIKLAAGSNLIRLSAANANALKGHEAEETTVRSVVVIYKPSKMPAPRIVLEKLMPVQPGDAVALEPGVTPVVHDKEMQLVGVIEGPDSLAEAKRDDRALAGFVANSEKTYHISEKLTFGRPGPQEVRIQARAQNSDSAEVVLTVDYQPELPRPVLTTPPRGLLVVDDGKGPAEIAINGQLVPPADPQPFTLELLANDRPIGALQSLAADAKAFSGKFVPQAGENHIRVRVRRAGSELETGDSLDLRFVRPPRVTFGPQATDLTQPVGKALVDIVGTVQSDLPLPTDGVTAEINGREIAGLKPESAGKNQWSVPLKQVPLDQGKNEIKLWASNADGRCVQPATLALTYQPPPKAPNPPEVSILEPLLDAKVTVPQQRFRIRVSSAVPLQRLTLVRGGKTSASKPIDVAGLKANPQGVFEVEEANDWNLAPGENVLRVEAVNAAGEKQASVVVNYIYSPVRLAIDGLAPKSNPDNILQPRFLSNARMVFSDAPEGRCYLQGKVLWDESSDERMKGTTQLTAYVNGKRQRPVLLRPAENKERARSFRTELQLSRATDNLVEIDLPGLPREADTRNEFTLNCSQPETGQSARLLIVSYQNTDKAKLIERAMQALQAERLPDGTFRSPAFRSGRIYGPLTGPNVTPDRVFTQLCIIKKQVDVLAQEGSANDVVIVYYEGKEAVTDDGHFFETGASVEDPDLERSAFSCSGLDRALNDVMGAQILLLEVARDYANSSLHGQDRDLVVKRPDQARLGVLRYLVGDKLSNVPQLLSDLKTATGLHQSLAEVDSFITDAVKHYPSPPTFDGTVPNPLKPLPVGK